jgi:competence protein ComEA
MQQILAIAHRRSLVGAAVACAIGAALIARTLLGAANATTEQPPVDEYLFEEQPAAVEIAQPAAPAEASVIVYVSGAVAAPDVYQLPAAARVKDLVLAAGGLSAEADPDAINLAAPLSDGQHIYVPRRGETTDAPAAPVGAAPEAATTTGGRIDLNTAGAAELDELPGIGQAIAERIVAYRESNGPFRSVADLQNVKGIGPSLIEQITPLVAIGP